MSQLQITNGTATIKKTTVIPDDLQVSVSIDISKKKEDNYKNENYPIEIKINNYTVRKIIYTGDERKITGNHSTQGTSVTLFGKEDDAYIRLLMIIYSKIEALTADLVSQGKLTRQFWSPFNKDGDVYKARNIAYAKKLKKDGKDIEDAPVFYGLNGTIYSIGELCKTQFLRLVRNRPTTLLVENGNLTAKKVLAYNKTASKLAKSSSAGEKYSSKFFSTYYGEEDWKKLVKAANTAKENPNDEEANKFISNFGKIPEKDELKDILTNTSTSYAVFTIMPHITDANINKIGMSIKLIADKIVFKPYVSETNETEDAEYQAYLRSLNSEEKKDEEPESLNIPTDDFN